MLGHHLAPFHLQADVHLEAFTGIRVPGFRHKTEAVSDKGGMTINTWGAFDARQREGRRAPNLFTSSP